MYYLSKSLSVIPPVSVVPRMRIKMKMLIMLCPIATVMKIENNKDESTGGVNGSNEQTSDRNGRNGAFNNNDNNNNHEDDNKNTSLAFGSKKSLVKIMSGIIQQRQQPKPCRDWVTRRKQL